LKEHLEEVGNGAKRNVEEAGRADLSPYAFLAGGLHDVAKYTSFFQAHLRSGKRVDCSDHAKLSSLLGFHASEHFRKDPSNLPFSPPAKGDLYSALVAPVIYSHHGRLRGLRWYHDVLDKIKEELDNPSSCINRQYNDLQGKWNTIKSEVPWAPDLPPLGEMVSNVERVVRGLMLRDFGWVEYLDGLLLFSSLIDADKHSAAQADVMNSPLRPIPCRGITSP